MITVFNKIDILEIGGETVNTVAFPQLSVKSHPRDRRMVILQINGRDKIVAVLADDLRLAIENATNTWQEG